MSIDILAFLVTGLGIVLCVSLIAMVMLGKRIDRPTDGAQELEFKGLRAKTNVVIMFLIVSLVPALLPLYLVLNRPPADTPGVVMYENWKVGGRIDAQDPDTSTLLVQPPHPHVNPDGTFSSDMPVRRKADGKLDFPSVLIEHPGYHSQSVDMAWLRTGGSFGGPDLQAEFNDADKSILLHKPIKLSQKQGARLASGAAVAAGGPK
jgi:hypothetical protein